MLNEQGYAMLSMGDVAREAGVSRATIYNQFTNKKVLVGRVVQTALTEMRDYIHQTSGTPIERLESVVRHFLQEGAAHNEIIPLRTHIGIRRLMDEDPNTRLLSRSLLVALEQIIKEGKAAGEIDDALSEIAIISLMWGLFTLLDIPPEMREGPTMDALIDQTVQMFMKSIQPTPP
jgi:AcrR family transcriptional regulator